MSITNPVGELYSIQLALRSLGEILENKGQDGEAYTALLLSKSIQGIAEQMDNEDWEAAREPRRQQQQLN
ncbi:hypothetical protein [Pseudodesulfovibrio indicus]|uniref:hypothetical protein n=1 Tax=Pseudodesulfovibrio indicus TaxID=1716143 RepID=UPI00292E1ECB|nr:hypothetical protein [Pseudodesulfovibrio indicus]